MPVAARSYMVADPDTARAVRQLDTDLAACDITPSFGLVCYDTDHDDARIVELFAARYPGLPVIGGTSFRGALTDRGVGGTGSIGVLLLGDADGFFGIAGRELGEDPAGAAEQALLTALERADSVGELPELIWIYQAPGREEQVLSGLRRVVGDRCPILGGSSGDNDVSGQWRQLSPDGVFRDGVVVTALFPSGGVSFSYLGGTQPIGIRGTVTAVAEAAGGPSRRVTHIDDRFAADVYNEWFGNILPEEALVSGGSILTETAAIPIGIRVGDVAGVPQFRLVHPAASTAERGLDLFAEVEVGTELHAMRAGRTELIERIGHAAALAKSAFEDDSGELAGGIVIYCGGSRTVIEDDVEHIADLVSAAWPGSPYLCFFTFGEQGWLLNSTVHANLMVSTVVFGA